MKLIDTVAWRNNAVSRYESIIAIQQRFCALNHVRLEHFLDFAEEAKVLVRYGKGWRYSRDLIRVDMPRLGKVLVEGNCLDLSSTSSFYPVSGAEEFRLENFWYCPKCIRRGYHTLAHQLNWLDSCLIHGEKLVSECPSCGVELSFKRNQVPLSKYCCTKCGAALWSDYSSKIWPLPLTDSEVAPIGDYVVWAKKCLVHPKFVAIARATGFASIEKHHPSLWINEIGSIVKRPATVFRAWSGDSSPQPRRFRSFFPADKAKLVVQTCNLFSTRELINYVTTISPEGPGVRSISGSARLWASHIERHHAKCRKLAEEAVSGRNAADSRYYNYRAEISQICLPLLFASHLRSHFHAEKPYPPIARSQSPNEIALREWLISSGLLQRADGFTSRAGAFSALPGQKRWVFDHALLWLVKIYVREIFWSHASWFLGHFEKADRESSVYERVAAFRKLAWPDHRKAGVFLLPFAKKGELFVMSWWENAGPREPTQVISYTETHAAEVAHRAIWVNEAVRFDNADRRQRAINAIKLFEANRP